MDNQGPTIKHMELCSKVMWQPGWEGVWGWGMDTCVCTARPLHGLPETISTLLTDYTPIQNKR